MPKPPRPVGVTILAVLEFVVGFFSLFGGLVIFLSGVLDVVVGYGLWTGRGWAWLLGVVLSVVGIFINVIGIAVGSYVGLFSIAIYALIWYYLTRPPIRSYFGRGAPATSTPS